MTDLGKIVSAVQSTRTEAAREATLAARDRAPQRQSDDGDTVAYQPVERPIPKPVFLKPIPMPHGAAATHAVLDLDGKTPGDVPRPVTTTEAARAYVQSALPGHDRVSFLNGNQSPPEPGSMIKVSA